MCKNSFHFSICNERARREKKVFSFYFIIHYFPSLTYCTPHNAQYESFFYTSKSNGGSSSVGGKEWEKSFFFAGKEIKFISHKVANNKQHTQRERSKRKVVLRRARRRANIWRCFVSTINRRAESNKHTFEILQGIVSCALYAADILTLHCSSLCTLMHCGFSLMWSCVHGMCEKFINFFYNSPLNVKIKILFCQLKEFNFCAWQSLLIIIEPHAQLPFFHYQIGKF